ncbi:hypothetical protein FE633_45010 [Streptomyces montanus]|uniref:Uncharacterized protein n=1 Tax=Streptomyces montanus TaxID=2580423 RepID=A0A5R9FBF2_9ACTN|nr:hypothetical protein FE633_45010 [Streptomyces montanus]
MIMHLLIAGTSMLHPAAEAHLMSDVASLVRRSERSGWAGADRGRIGGGTGRAVSWSGAGLRTAAWRRRSRPVRASGPGGA